VQPTLDGDSYRFEVRVAPIPPEALEGTKVSRGANFKCLLSNAPIEPAYIKSEGIVGRMGNRLMAVVAEGPKGRVYLSPDDLHATIASLAEPTWTPDAKLPNDPRNFWTLNYGLTSFGDLFTRRQLVALNTFSELVTEAMALCQRDALFAGFSPDRTSLDDGGSGAFAYAQAVSVYLAFAVDRSSDFWSNLCLWANQPKNELVAHLFSRQCMPMSWGYAEVNPFSGSGGNFINSLMYICDGMGNLPSGAAGVAKQGDAMLDNTFNGSVVISTDPPYYDNIGYADLSDYFYIWLRRALRPIFEDEFATILVPKSAELVADPYRHNGKAGAEQFFTKGMKQVLVNLAEHSHPAIPLTLYYAFKQASTKDDITSNTGWESFLTAVMEAGLTVNGTWPIRSEHPAESRGALMRLLRR
jgi:putative DNA methylase